MASAHEVLVSTNKCPSP